MGLIKSRFLGMMACSMAMGLTLNAGFAETNQADAVSPEATLLAETQAIQGSLKDQQAQAAMSTALAEYAHQYADAPISAQEQSDRFQKAMVAVGLTTPAQAATVMSSIENSSAQMAQGQISSDEFAQRVQELAQVNAHGAQFSMTGRELVVSWMAATAGGIGMAGYGFSSGNTALGIGGIGLAVGVTGIFFFLAQGA